MKIDKQELLEFLRKWEKENRTEKVIKKILKTRDFIEYETISYEDVCEEYINQLQFYLNTDDTIKSGEEILEFETEYIEQVADGEVNTYNDLLEKQGISKLDYLLSEHPEYLDTISFERDKHNVYRLLSVAEYYIISDFLHRFHYELKKQAESELL
ncbi:hypothetical protein VO56_02250 [Mycoplasmopsis gallinacea]|uniref:Uncharacterized protein n=1 Tax=Mycoplasmopsis gallinacea TaxID=29556 RepID=A0A0D5ZK85_9BACT|nr:hypothetical protein VO56_02250 [Mycoplasmopsis gallinacea]